MDENEQVILLPQDELEVRYKEKANIIYALSWGKVETIITKRIKTGPEMTSVIVNMGKKDLERLSNRLNVICERIIELRMDMLMQEMEAA